MDAPLPPIGVSAAFLPFAIIAVAMVGLTIFVFGRVLPADGRPPLLTQMLLALGILGGGSVLLLALVFVFLNPNATTAWTWVLLGFNFMMMAPAGLWFVSLVIFQDRRIVPDGWLWPLAFGTAVTGSEAIMGVLFALVGADGPLAAGPALALGLSSAWFFWSMAAVMVALVAWAPLAPVERFGSVALALAAVLAPWVTADPLAGGLAMVALMVGVFALLTRLLLRRPVTAGEVGFLIGLDGAFLAMALSGLSVVLGAGSVPTAIAFGSVMGVAMAGEVTYLVRRFYRGVGAAPWVVRTADPEVTPPRRSPGAPSAPGPARSPTDRPRSGEPRSRIRTRPISTHTRSARRQGRP